MRKKKQKGRYGEGKMKKDKKIKIKEAGEKWREKKVNLKEIRTNKERMKTVKEKKIQKKITN